MKFSTRTALCQQPDLFNKKLLQTAPDAGFKIKLHFLYKINLVVSKIVCRFAL